MIEVSKASGVGGFVQGVVALNELLQVGHGGRRGVDVASGSRWRWGRVIRAWCGGL
ncbi:MAG: hypothetical protein M3460_29700 [Actinomycetota bacterium]|nr:hypothetical protein [Actinomycetota bacterium]